MNPPFFFLSKKLTRKRSGVSPVIATTIILAITITLGLGLWSFATSGVSVATDTYGKAVTEYGNFVADRFVVANVDFDNPSNDHIALWIYNSGKTSSHISSVVVTCKDCSAFSPNPGPLTRASAYDPTDPQDCPLCVKTKQLEKFSFDTQTTIESGKTYELTIVSETGALQSFIKRSE